MLYDLMLIAIGLVSSFILFAQFPILKTKRSPSSDYKISIIIPARNEEENIALLLEDLMRQKSTIHEIICVDDCSTDETYKIASSFDVKTIAIDEKPADWEGKAWACQVGGDAARGDILLFLDADVRLRENAIASLIHSYHENKCVISVQPYHKTEKYYEELSFFFNLIQIGGNGTSVGFMKENAGLYGPVILIDRETYNAIGGHLPAKNSIVDDLALTKALKKKGYPFKLFMGGENISLRMYGDGLKSLMEGWAKNYATGASRTPIFIFILVFLWISSSMSSALFLIKSTIYFDPIYFSIALFSYFCWVLELFRISYRIGSFKKTTILLFPVYLAFFLLVFFVSLFKKIFRLNVTWKGRKIKLGQ